MSSSAHRHKSFIRASHSYTQEGTSPQKTHFISICVREPIENVNRATHTRLHGHGDRRARACVCVRTAGCVCGVRRPGSVFLKITLLHIRQGSTNILIGYISWCCKHRDKLRSQGPTPRSPETKEVPRGARASARDAEAKGAGTADHVVVPPIRLGLHLLPVQVLQQRVGAYVRILIRDVGLPPQCVWCGD